MYRIYLDSYSRKATHIVRNRKTVEALLPRDHGCIVKEFNGKCLIETYLVSWLGDHYKWDACHSESDH